MTAEQHLTNCNDALQRGINATKSGNGRSAFYQLMRAQRHYIDFVNKLDARTSMVSAFMQQDIDIVKNHNRLVEEWEKILSLFSNGR
jgi:hypothetical protein